MTGRDDERSERASPEITKMVMVALALTGIGILFDVGGSPPLTAAFAAVIAASATHYAVRFGMIMGGYSRHDLPRSFAPTVIIGVAVVFAVLAFVADYTVVTR